MDLRGPVKCIYGHTGRWCPFVAVTCLCTGRVSAVHRVWAPGSRLQAKRDDDDDESKPKSSNAKPPQAPAAPASPLQERAASMHSMMASVLVPGFLCAWLCLYDFSPCLCMNNMSREPRVLEAEKTPPGWCSVWWTRRGGGWGVRDQKQVCVPKVCLHFRAPLINFFFSSEEMFPMWMRGAAGVGQGCKRRLG